MIGVRSYAEKAVDAVSRNQAAVDRATAQLKDHDRARPEGDDADAIYGWTRLRRDLEDRLAAAADALKFAEEAAAKRAAEEAVREKDRQYAAAKKLAEAHRDGTLEIVALSAKLAAKITENEAKRQKIASANLGREHRPYILDGEEQVRRIPERIIPAEYRDEVVWEDGAGNRPYTYRRGADGELEPAELGFIKKIKRVCQSEARTEPPRMPRRLAEVVKLVDLAGNQIWPAR